MIVNSANLNKLRVGFTALYMAALLAAKPNYKRVAMEVPSTGKEQKYGWLGMSTRFKEWLGDRTLQNLKEHDYSIKNKPFENTVVVNKDDIEDDTLGIYNPLFQQLGWDASMHPDELVFDLMASGFGGVKGLCYDGQYFFDTDHPLILADGTISSYSNTGGGSGAPWFLIDSSKPIKPIIFQKRKDYKLESMMDETDTNVFMRKEFIFGVDARVNAGYGLPQLAYGSKQTLDATSYATARATLLGMKADGGKSLGIMPDLLVVGPSNEAAAKKIVMAEKDAAGATNIHNGTAQILVVPYLT